MVLKVLKILKWILAFVFFLLLSTGCVYIHAAETDSKDSFLFKIDKKNRARIAHHGIPIIVSVGNFFEFYNRNIDGSRKRIVSGPWNGLLAGKIEKKSPELFILSGVSNDGHIKFVTTYKLIGFNTLEIEIKLSSQKQSGQFSYEIAKLNPVFFKGCRIQSKPFSVADIRKLPEDPRPFNNRLLLKKKSLLTINAKGVELEIQDMQGSNSISMADFRNVSWDRKSSFYLGGKLSSVEAGKFYSVRYRIRLVESSKKTLKAASFPTNLNNDILAPSIAESFYAIPCKSEKLYEQLSFFSGPLSVFTDQGGEEVDIFCKKLSKLTGKSIIANLIKINAPPPGEGIIFTDFKNGSSMGPQSFEINVTSKRILIRGNDEPGRLFAAYKVLSLFTMEKDELRVRCGKYKDWPDIKTRGMMIELLPPPRKDIELFKRYIDALSMARVNLIIFWHRPQDLLKWDNKKQDRGWSKKEIAEIATYAKSRYMDVWGGMVSKFHPKYFPELNIAKGSDFYNPFQEKSFKRLFTLFTDIIDCYGPSGILIGHDEIKGLNIYSKKSKIPTSEILSNAINKIHGWLSSKNIKTIVAGDMLLDVGKWKRSVGGGGVNSGNPIYNSGDTGKAIDTLSKGVVIFDWHYNKAADYRTLKYFSDKGFAVLGATWHDPKASCTMSASVKKYKIDGIIGTDYGFWRTLSPAATTLYSPICAWSISSLVSGKDDDVIALASILKDQASSGGLYHQSPFPLTDYANEFMIDNKVGDGKGFFDLGTYADLRNLPSGLRKLKNVEFDILPDNGFHRKNCLVVGFDANGKPEPIGKMKISFKGRSCKGLAFLQTCYLDDPDYKHRKVGQYLVEYQNGQKERIDIIQNWNITDLRSSPLLRRNNWTFKRRPDILIGSDLAWQGASGMEEPLNIQKFVWINPYPEYPIDYVSIKANEIGTNSKVALIGLTILN